MSVEQKRIGMIMELLARHPARPTAPLLATVGARALDDCAVVPLGNGSDLVIGSDFIRGEGFHLFRRKVLSWRDVGHYLVAANASDLAAMGAKPFGIVVVMRYSPAMTDSDFGEVMDGVAAACAELGMPLLGGDTGGYEASVLSAAAFGICPSGRALLRSGGKVGDRLFVTGTVGLAGAALAYFTRGVDEGVSVAPEDEAALANAWRHICPALAQGQLLVEAGLSRCAIDTSDGLKAACRQLAEASGVDAVLSADSIPVDPIAATVATRMRVDPLALAVGDSVDFRLVFSAADSDASRVREEFAARGWPLYEIGRLEASVAEPRVLLEVDGQRVDVPGIEWAQSGALAIDSLRGGFKQ